MISPHFYNDNYVELAQEYLLAHKLDSAELDCQCRQCPRCKTTFASEVVLPSLEFLALAESYYDQPTQLQHKARKNYSLECSHRRTKHSIILSRPDILYCSHLEANIIISLNYHGLQVLTLCPSLASWHL